MQLSICEDKEWDDYLQSTEMGQFQQSSMWAKYKEHTGWSPDRVVLRRNNQIVGGFQLLMKKTKFLKIGYVSKGPVVENENIIDIENTIDAMFDVLTKNKIFALVVQPPDNSLLMGDVFRRRFFHDVPMLGVIDATLMNSSDGGKERIEKTMTREKRRMIRQGIRCGIVVREGGRADVPLFFEMMSASCGRQGEGTPNPGSVGALDKLWEIFDSQGCIRLTFAEFDREPLAGLLCIGFGNRVTLWKKGWSGKGREWHPNDILYMDAFLWACEKGFSVCDFAGLDTGIARALIDGNPMTDQQRASRDIFNLHFGGIPKLLPNAMIYLRNPLIRRAFGRMAGTDSTSWWFTLFRKYSKIA